MKRYFLLPILAVLLAGCTAAPETEIPAAAATEPTTVVETSPIEPTGYYDPDSTLEASSQGALRLYPLNRTDAAAVYPMGEDLLLVSGTDGTTLSVLSGSTLYVRAAANLDCCIDTGSPAFLVSEKGVAYYDELHCSLVFLDASLKEVNRFALSEEIIGQPGLTSDRKLLYYCTASALRVMDLQSGLDKLLREMVYPYQTLQALHYNNTLIECLIQEPNFGEKRIFINPETGETVGQTDAATSLLTGGDHYWAIHPDGVYPEHLTGSAGQDPMVLQPLDYNADIYPVLSREGVITVSFRTDTATQMDYYDLITGMRTASVQLNPGTSLQSIQAQPDTDCIWALGYDPTYECDVLYCWDLTKTTTEDTVCYLNVRRNADAPDTEGLDACAQTAEAISEKYSVEILLWQDAVEVHPSDYTLEPEYQVPLIQNSLEILDKALSNFPEGFLKKAAYRTDSRKIRICLVRSINGNPGANVLRESLGIQFWDDSEDTFIVVALGDQLEQTFYHELFHILESRVMSRSSAYDNWNDLNPEGFDYTYDTVKNLLREDYQWVEGEERAFIDLYSMSFPKEDRARIMEYAMMAGNEACFETEAMQQKLRTLCIGIRDAFGLKKSTEAFLWEQYLNEPLAAK